MPRAITIAAPGTDPNQRIDQLVMQLNEAFRAASTEGWASGARVQAVNQGDARVSVVDGEERGMLTGSPAGPGDQLIFGQITIFETTDQARFIVRIRRGAARDAFLAYAEETFAGAEDQQRTVTVIGWDRSVVATQANVSVGSLVTPNYRLTVESDGGSASAYATRGRLILVSV